MSVERMPALKASWERCRPHTRRGATAPPVKPEGDAQWKCSIVELDGRGVGVRVVEEHVGFELALERLRVIPGRVIVVRSWDGAQLTQVRPNAPTSKAIERMVKAIKASGPKETAPKVEEIETTDDNAPVAMEDP